MAKLRGRKTGANKPAGQYDTYVLLAIYFNWTPEEVNRLDPHFLDELVCRLVAEADWQDEKEKRRKREEEERERRNAFGRR